MADSPNKSTRILLISPHYRAPRGYKIDLTPPLGLAYIAAVLEREGYTVKILDVVAEDFHNRLAMNYGYVRAGLSYEAIEHRISEFKPAVVGVSCLLSSQFQDMCNICQIAKEKCGVPITVVGGEHTSALPEESLEKHYIDFVVIGEGEYTMRDLMRRISEGADYSDLDGLGFKKDGQIVVNPKTKFIENIDELPLPARHLLPMETYFKTNIPQSGTSAKSPNTPMMTSRGCPGRCVFCATAGFWGNRQRARSVRKVLDEMETLVRDYGVREIQFIDDNLTLNRDRAMALFNGMIERNLDLVWNTPQGIAVWGLDEEVLKKMKESGCYEITLGIESGDPGVLKNIVKKSIPMDKIERIAKAARKIGLITKGYFVVGLPGETLEQMNKTFELAKRLRLDAVGIFIATPLPGTELYRICKEKGYLKEGFSHERVNYARGNIETPDFTPRQVEQLVSKNILRINLGLLLRNPLRFFKKYFRIFFTNPGSLVKYVLFLLRESRAKEEQATSASSKLE
ncbi:MAG: cobalamin-dependent protein [Candidatus Coatesbacteria bacterium]|nr:cobalamin-dependent protein [Candidatus Coatesbacteria bacterium]